YADFSFTCLRDLRSLVSSVSTGRFSAASIKPLLVAVTTSVVWLPVYSYHCSTRKEVNIMTRYMDIHRQVEGLTADAAEGAHVRDLEVQGKYGANYLKYWFDEGSGTVFCLIEAPSKEAAEAVHGEAPG